MSTSTPRPQSAARPASTALAVITNTLGSLQGLTILDVGCGGGALAAQLAQLGAIVTGIDPLEEALQGARRLAPDCRFQQASAQSLPFADNSFAAVLFSNALHHVPQIHMLAAIAEAVRVSAGPLIIIEPLAEGPFFDAMRPIEDETVIRGEAQDAISNAAKTGIVVIDQCIEYNDERKFTDIDGFLAKVVAADPARAQTAKRERDAVASLAAPHRDAAGIFFLPQPHRAHILRRP